MRVLHSADKNRNTRRRQRVCEHYGRRFLSLLLCLCMVVSMICGAEIMTALSVEPGPTENIVIGSRVADPDTMDDYLNRLLTAESGSRYAGRVWTDKSVFAYGTGAERASGSHFDGKNKITLDMNTDGYVGDVLFNADFAHVFSALASSQVVNEYPPSPVDLVIVFDMSGSMGQDTRYEIDPGRNMYVAHTTNAQAGGGAPLDDDFPEVGVPMAERIENSRIQQTLDAINQTIDKLMAQNPQNRVAVCGYGANAVVLMPLGHYKKVDADGDGIDDPYLSVGGMETLYHPSDLVYREPDDDLKMGNTLLPSVTEEEKGWYWMNNRDTCYTVVVNAQYNTYTGVLNENGDGKGQPGENKTTDGWTNVKKIVSNNALTDDGTKAKAFPGDWDDGKTPKDTYAALSRTVYEGSSSDKSNAWTGGVTGFSNGTKLRTAFEKQNAVSLAADDYVGYFTNTQGGIYIAYKQLADSTATTYTEELTNGVISTVARIPAAIIMSDGGANFSLNEMGNGEGEEFTVNDWNGRYGQRYGDILGYLADNTVNPAGWNHDNAPWKGRPLDVNHRLSINSGDEWYKVYLPGNDTLAHDAMSGVGDKGYWDGLHGLYNNSADIFEDGTLSSAPTWDRPGVFYSSDNNVTGTAGTVMEVLLTASYMSHVVQKHYSNGWTTDGATEESKSDLFTYTMNVDTVHVPLWGQMRLYPTLDPKTYNLNDIDTWYKDPTNDDKFGTDDTIQGTLPEEKDYEERSEITKQLLFEGGKIEGTITEKGVTSPKTYDITGLKQAWAAFKAGQKTSGPNSIEGNGSPTNIIIEPIPESGAAYTAGGNDVITVKNEDVVNNIAYNDGFFDVTSETLDTTFNTILGLILGSVFVPVSGDNDAGVGDSITYQDPLGEYMEIKDGSITATPHHVGDPDIGKDGAQTYDMSLLLFGEMHGLVRVGVYDYQWNDKYMRTHSEGTHGQDPFPIGWYLGDDPEKAVKAVDTGSDDAGSFPKYKNNKDDTGGLYTSANEARADGWVYRLNFSTLVQFVPIVDAPANGLPQNLSPQVMNTKYTIYRFAGSQKDRNELKRNPIYGEGVPEKFTTAWEQYFAEKNKYPDRIEDLPGIDVTEYPGIYRLSDIRVWVEDTGDYTDTDGAFTPNGGYDRSLYVNIPVAAIPTELATITLGPDGVLSYETNLGADHKPGTFIMAEKDGEMTKTQVTQEMYENFCYQSTPFRLFYAVGLEDDLILRDENGKQTGVDFNAISPEYLQSHTDAENHVWFISNYYSETRYSGYATDNVSRTRGDPTVTFSPGIDNRYYVFQKPLPLYAHAYRVSTTGTGYTGPVDMKSSGFVWDGSAGHGNSETEWEDGSTGGASWRGGQFMGVYTTAKEFENAQKEVTTSADGKTQYIIDSHGIRYEYVDGGIIFSEEDLLDHVTSLPDDEGGGYTEDSHSFSSDDYYFILLEFYVPYPDIIGKNNAGEEVPGTQAGHMIQYALARKGSEFGSGYASSNITNGDMLCWTDTNDKLNVEFAYVSKSDTGDRTRGEPTWEKLTYTDSTPITLKEYLESIGLNNVMQVPNPNYDPNKDKGPDNQETVGALDQQLAYWTEMQANPQVRAALQQALNNAGTDGADISKLTKENFNDYFGFAVATRPGGIRSGDMSNNLQYKGDVYNAETGYYDDNNTKTSNTYYLPTISDNSGTDNNVIINNYLGNNGRLEIANEMLHVTKRLKSPDGFRLTDEQKAEEFNFQIYVQGVSGTRSAVLTEYNEYSGSWERELAYIDVLTDNSDLVQTNNSTRALFVLEKASSTLEGGSVDVAKQVLWDETTAAYYYADEDGILPTVDGGAADEEQKVSTDVIGTGNENLYYMYLPSNGAENTESAHVHRLYQNKDYKGADSTQFTGLDKNGTTTFVKEGQHEITGTEPGVGNTDSYRPADEGKRPAGTRTYWTQAAELIPKSEVDTAEAGDILMGDPGEPGGIATMALEAVSGGTWTHSEHTIEHDSGDHKDLTFHTFVIRRPAERTSATNFASPYKTRTQYLTAELNFGYNANDPDKDGGPGKVGSELKQDDLYYRPSGLSSDELDAMAAGTAEFTLNHGEGLLLTGLDENTDYRFTEKLTEDQKANGYTLKEIEQIQQESSPKYTDANSVSGDTGFNEEQVNYINTVDPELLMLTKEIHDASGNRVDTPIEREFEFTLTLSPTGDNILPADTTLYMWKGTKTYTDTGVTLTSSLTWEDTKGATHNMPAAAPSLGEYQKFLSGEQMLQPITPADGKYSVKLKANEAAVFYGMLNGQKYTFSETAVKKYPAEGGVVEKSGEIARSQGTPTETQPTTLTKNRADFVNLLNSGTLTVEKYIHDDNREEVTEQFTFKVTLTPTNETELIKEDINIVKYGKNGDKTESFDLKCDETKDVSGRITALTYTFTLKHGEKVVIDGIPYNTAYNVAESDTAGYYLEHVADNSGDRPGSDGNFLKIERKDNSVSGTVTNDNKAVYLLFNNAGPIALPFTGSVSKDIGMRMIMGAGMLLMIAASAVVFVLQKRRRTY